MASQPGIVLYRDNYQNVRGVLTQSQKGDLLDALMDGEYQGGDQLVTMAYNIFAAAIRRTDEKYQAIRAKNQEAARIRWERMREKADAYDRMQADADAYGEVRDDATQSQSQPHPKAETHDRERNIFSPPSADEVREYCRERKNAIDADQFVAYYSARGWELRPGQKMKDWRAAVRTWEKYERRWKDGLRGADAGDHVPGQRDLYES